MIKILSVLVFFKNPNSIDEHETSAIQIFRLNDFFFFTRSSIKELIIFCCKEISKRILNEKFYRIEFDDDHKEMLLKYNLQNIICNVLMSDDKIYCIVTNNKYESLPIYELILQIKEKIKERPKTIRESDNNILMNMTTNTEEHLIEDRLSLIKKDLDDTREELMISIDKLLNRGEKLEDLIDRTNDLSMSTKLFHKKSNDLNKCCPIL